MTETQIMEITIDTIKELRLKGNYEEAKTLLKNFHEEVKRCGIQAFKEECIIARKIKILKGLCSSLYCKNKALPGFKKCAKCRKSNNKSSKKYYHNNFIRIPEWIFK